MKSKTKTISVCALMCALAVVIMLLGGFIPVMTYCSPIIASLCLIPIMNSFGKRYTLLSYVVISLLSVLLSPDKESAFFWIFFAWYPVVQPILNLKIRNKVACFLSKMLLFAVLTFLMYYITCSVLGIKEILESFSSSGVLNTVFYILVVVVMLIYDILLSRMNTIYKKKLEKFVLK